MVDHTLSAYEGDAPYFFVCYSHADSETVLGEMRWFHDAGVHLWYDEGIEAGTTWRRAVAEALEKATAVIFMCSGQSLASTHCRKEVSYALDHDKPIFVVRLDATQLTPELALYLNDTQILERDARAPDTYRQKLLTALSRHVPVQADAPAAPLSAVKSRKRLPAYAAVAAIVVLLAAGAWLSQPGEDEDASSSTNADGVFDFPRIAIMPMEILTPDDTLNFLARASEDDLRGRMQASIFEPINIPAAAETMPVKEIGHVYDVDYVWYRSVARQGDIVRVSKRLAETVTGQDVRVVQRDLQGSDPFDLQDQLAKYTEDIMGAIDQGEGERADRIPLEEMNARDLVYTSKGDRRSNIRRALELEPDLFMANGNMANILYNDYYMQRTENPDEVAAEALKFARRARELAPFDQFANAVATKLEMSVGNPEKAYSYANAFLKLKSVSTYEFYDALIATGHVQQALEHLETNPLARSFTRGVVYLAAGRYEEACKHYQTWTVEEPGRWIPWWNLANCLGYLDDRETVAQIMKGLRDNGFMGTVADVEIGTRRYWGPSDFADTLLNGLKRLGYQ